MMKGTMYIEYMEFKNLSTEILNFLLTLKNGCANITLAKDSGSEIYEKKKGDMKFRAVDWRGLVLLA